MKLFLHTCFLLLLTFFFLPKESAAQYFKLRGNVYDSTKTYPLSSVTVLTTSGKGATTDMFGRYEIDVKESDSVWFSYLNKPTVKYSVAKIFDARQFDIALHIYVPVLKEVVIRPRNYKMDSLQNRLDYAKAFDWQKPKLRANVGSDYGSAVGFDLNEIIRMFQFRRNKSMEKFQERLLQQERDKFIDYRFNKGLVLRLTGLTGEVRDSFMLRCRPTYEFCLLVTEYEFQAWIKECFEKFRLQTNNGEIKKTE